MKRTSKPSSLEPYTNGAMWYIQDTTTKQLIKAKPSDPLPYRFKTREEAEKMIQKLRSG